MKFTAHPLGSRVIIKDITPDEFRSEGGVIVPQMKGAPDADLGLVRNSPALRVVEVVAVGEGRADPATGKYSNGSRLKVGEKYLMRGGATSQQHMDSVPGRVNEFVVLEDTLVCRCEEILPVSTSDRPKLVAVS
jgi:co-chaperonin GroES (HSP10)